VEGLKIMRLIRAFIHYAPVGSCASIPQQLINLKYFIIKKYELEAIKNSL
jgi:hypothetical protein